jgi:hypothetical protein
MLASAHARSRSRTHAVEVAITRGGGGRNAGTATAQRRRSVGAATACGGIHPPSTPFMCACSGRSLVPCPTPIMWKEARRFCSLSVISTGMWRSMRDNRSAATSSAASDTSACARIGTPKVNISLPKKLSRGGESGSTVRGARPFLRYSGSTPPSPAGTTPSADDERATAHDAAAQEATDAAAARAARRSAALIVRSTFSRAFHSILCEGRCR